MAVAPLPTELPGEFFVLEWNRDLECYILHVDDGDGSSYNMGDEVSHLMLRFRLWGYEDIGNRTIDMAREFGAAQCIPDQNRVIALFDRTKGEVDVFEKEKRHARSYAHL